MQKFTEPRFIKPVSLYPEDRQRIAQRVRAMLASCEDVVLAYIYGSFARGEAVRDLDVALYTTEDKDFLFATDVAALLRKHTGFEVDVTVMNHAPVALQFAILRDGLLLFSKDEALRTALIERVSRQYWEYAHFRDLFLRVAGADRDRIAKNIADTAMAQGEIERLVAVDQATFFADNRNVFSVRYLIIQAVETMTDLCQYMLARTRGIPCEGYIDCIMKAGEHGIISVALAERLRRLAALRNILVHRYWSIDDARVYVETKANVGDLTTFIDAIEALVRTLP